MAGQKIKHRSGVPDGATAIGYEFDTQASLTTAGAKVISVKNAGVEKLAISKDGEIITSGAGGTWVVRPAEGGAGIQSAINAANAAGGGIVQLLVGTYVITSSIGHSSLSRVTVRGMGPGKTILDAQLTGAAQVFNVSVDQGPGLSVKNLNPTTADATTVVFTTAAEAGPYLVGYTVKITGSDADGFPRSEVNIVKTSGDTGTGNLVLERPLQYSLTSVTITGLPYGFDNCLRDFSVRYSSGLGGAISLSQQTRALVENIVTDGLNFSRGPGLAIDGQWITVRNCHARNFTAGSGDTMVGNQFSGIENLVEGCEFSNCGNDAFANNSCVDLQGSFRLKFTKNIVRDSNAYGIRVWNAGQSAECVISDNIVNNNDGTGIVLISASANMEYTIANNIVCYNNNAGIVCAGRRCSIIGNVCSFNPGSYGILVQGPDCLVSGNICNKNAYGIGISTGSSKVSVVGNNCDSNTNTGIYMNTTDSNFTGNSAQNNSVYGLWSSGSSADLVISGNIARNNTTANLLTTAGDSEFVISSNNFRGGTVTIAGTNMDAIANKV